MPDRIQISFIVPIFNAEKTLERCVHSLFCQELSADAYEIILVNDGSTDGSREICEKLSIESPCVRVVSKENKGLSEARNSGIRVAKGEYLCFVDADDCLAPSGLAAIIPYCDGKIDLIRYWCEFVCPNVKTVVDSGDGSVVFKGEGRAYLRKYGLETFCWNYLYRREFIERNQLGFKPGIVGEDFPFMFDVLMANPEMISLARRIYRYYIHSGSQSMARDAIRSRKRVNDLLMSMEEIASQLSPFRLSDNLLYLRCRQSLEARMITVFSRMMTSNYSVSEFRALVASCKNKDLLPLRHSSAGLKARISRSIINGLTSCPFLYPLISKFFTRLYLPYFYPRIDRYK